MPQANVNVSAFDLRGDLNNYYRGSVLTYVDRGERHPALVDRIDDQEENGNMTAVIRLLSGGDRPAWGSSRRVPWSALDLILPNLGMVELNGHWYHLCRHPARRMRKGYNAENISLVPLEDGDMMPDVDASDPKIVKQVWFGNPDRIGPTCVVWRKGIYYTTEKVALVNDEGAVTLIQNKEKLGEFVCKLLLNNWDVANLKHSVLTLPSSAPMLSV